MDHGWYNFVNYLHNIVGWHNWSNNFQPFIYTINIDQQFPNCALGAPHGLQQLIITNLNFIDFFVPSFMLFTAGRALWLNLILKRTLQKKITDTDYKIKLEKYI